MKMTSTRPYLIRAFYDWIVANNCTPHIVVNAMLPDVMVPQEYVDNGQIVLNIAMTAVSGLLLGEHAIEFQARFSGKARRIHVPIPAILAIYAKENGRGMVFAEEEGDLPPPAAEGTGGESGPTEKDNGNGSGKGGAGGRPHLKIVK